MIDNANRMVYDRRYPHVQAFYLLFSDTNFYFFSKGLTQWLIRAFNGEFLNLEDLKPISDKAGSEWA